ncbi:hypothetical protein [Parafilimonas sp.]|uniref:hypothetical protein n=1 Tax=Parafilimonas sp. TaxID=1969739 RepID=UPI0039E4CA93
MMKMEMNKKTLETRWYHYILAFFAGVFFVNTLPHYINGITGKEFPTPFADPPGIGLSSALTNVLWAVINASLGASIFLFVKINKRKISLWIALAAGGLLMSFFVAYYFSTRF